MLGGDINSDVIVVFIQSLTSVMLGHLHGDGWLVQCLAVDGQQQTSGDAVWTEDH